MESKKVLFVSQEITPYLPETELSLISRTLPQAIQETGKEIRTFMPKYGNINERRNQLHEVIRLSGMNLIIDDTDLEKYPNIKYDLAVKFIGFLTSEVGQTMISEFRKNGEILFRPAFGICNHTHDCKTTQQEIDIWKNHNGNYLGPDSYSSIFQTFR